MGNSGGASREVTVLAASLLSIVVFLLILVDSMDSYGRYSYERLNWWFRIILLFYTLFILVFSMTIGIGIRSLTTDTYNGITVLNYVHAEKFTLSLLCLVFMCGIEAVACFYVALGKDVYLSKFYRVQDSNFISYGSIEFVVGLLYLGLFYNVLTTSGELEPLFSFKCEMASKPIFILSVVFIVVAIEMAIWEVMIAE